jgi:N-glycosidase YbiA
MTKDITLFVGDYAFLSTFFPVEIIFQNITFPSIQHALVAAMTEDTEIQVKISGIPKPGIALQYGKTLRPFAGWDDEYRIKIMTDFIDQKFHPVQHPELVQKLLDTEDRILINTDLWGDDFFGVCVGKGSNHTGRLLMEKREKLRL